MSAARTWLHTKWAAKRNGTATPSQFGGFLVISPASHHRHLHWDLGAYSTHDTTLRVIHTQYIHPGYGTGSLVFRGPEGKLIESDMTRLVSVGNQVRPTRPGFFFISKSPAARIEATGSLTLTPINSLWRASDCADTMHHVRVTEALCTPPLYRSWEAAKQPAHSPKGV